MKRLLRLDVKNNAEFDAIVRAMADPQTRAFVVIVGTLLALDSDRARARVLRFVAHHVAQAQDTTLEDIERMGPSIMAVREAHRRVAEGR